MTTSAGQLTSLKLAMLAVAVVIASCGSSTVQTGAGSTPGERPTQCENAEGIADLLGSGLPLFDYDPATDVADLVAQTDVVITGTLDSVVRVESNNSNVSAGSEFLTAIHAPDPIAYGDPDDQFLTDFGDQQRFFIGSDWTGGDDPLAEDVLFDYGRTRFVAFLTSTGDASFPWAFGPQGLHVWCSGDDEVQSVIDAVPIGSTIDPSTFEQAIVEVVEPTQEFDFVDISARVIADDFRAGETWTARLVESVNNINPALTITDPDLDLSGIRDDEVLFEFVMAESGSCPLGPFETLRFDQLSRVLVPTFEQVQSPGDTCTADANPHLLLVAVAREDLPTSDFSIATSTSQPSGFDPVPISAVELAADN